MSKIPDPPPSLEGKPHAHSRMAPLRAWGRRIGEGAQAFVRHLGQALFHFSHNSLTLVGLGLVAVLTLVASRADLHTPWEHQTLAWLQARHAARVAGTAEALSGLAQPDAVARATAIDPADLTPEQATLTRWLSRRYKVAPEPVARLVQEAWKLGAKVHLDPTLILSIMAIESSFNPFAQSTAGAQGLMQVMTTVHDLKYEPFGGTHAAFDPITNLHVGVLVLKECIARAGSIQAGLRFYVGAANHADDGGYAWKVLSEQQHMQALLAGKTVSINVTLPPPPVASDLASSPEGAASSASAATEGPAADAIPPQDRDASKANPRP